jgi:hypothetical protein
MSEYFRDLSEPMQADLADALGFESWSAMPLPVQNNLRARKTNLDQLLE